MTKLATTTILLLGLVGNAQAQPGSGQSQLYRR
jgi:hypothetical protein